MLNLFVRRARLFPGPLKVVSAVERSPVPVTSLAVTAAAIAAALALAPQLSQRRSVDPTPMVEIAGGAAVVEQPAASPVAAAAVPAEPKVTAAPASQLVVPAVSEGSPTRSAAAAPAKPSPDQSLFEVARLPALQTDLAELDVNGPPPKSPIKRASRGSQQPNRDTAVAAASGPVQP